MEALDAADKHKKSCPPVKTGLLLRNLFDHHNKETTSFTIYPSYGKLESLTTTKKGIT